MPRGVSLLERLLGDDTPARTPVSGLVEAVGPDASEEGRYGTPVRAVGVEVSPSPTRRFVARVPDVDGE